MIRRLAHHVVDGYGSDPALTDLVDSTELWFVPVANPDGYDYTFTPGNRDWRKNLRDNNGDGRITFGDGVDLNRNFPTRWFYDDEGASSAFRQRDLPGPAPASEPETRAIDGLMRRVGFEFVLNYHSASEQLLYGTAWQVDTPTPDDVVYEAIAGDDAKSAVPGYDPDLLAENGPRQRRALRARPHRPRHAGVHPGDVVVPDRQRLRPGRRLGAGRLQQQFDFPDDEALVAAEFAKNVPFALAAARSTPRPRQPGLGRRPNDARVRGRRFDVSYGDPQTVAVTARRRPAPAAAQLPDQRRPHPAGAGDEWGGGERYGGERDVYYAEYRGQGHAAPAPATGSRCGSPPRGPAPARSRATTSPTRRPPTPGPTP